MTRIAILFLLTALLMAACVPAITPLAAPPVGQAETSPQPTAPDAADPVELASPVPSTGATPTARGGQEATDPTTVVLGAGRPTLIKFFAFW